MEHWRVLKLNRYDAITNMAIDEALFLNALSGNSVTTLRFYMWKNRSISLGYFQDERRDINISLCQKLNIDIVKRVTGGTAVLHNNDLTYALVCGRRCKVFPKNIKETYMIITRCIIDGLRNIGIEASFAKRSHAPFPIPKKGHDPFSHFCFLAPSSGEVLANRKKLIGSAQRRKGWAFLQHGSIPLAIDSELCSDIFLHNVNLSKDEKVKYLESNMTSINAERDTETSAEDLQNALIGSFKKCLAIDTYEGALSGDEMMLVDRIIEKRRKDERVGSHLLSYTPLSHRLDIEYRNA